MASTQARVDLLVGRMATAGDIEARKMFGEYGLYCDGVFFGLVADDQLFIKPTPATAALTEGLMSAPPYPGARPSLVVPDARSEDRVWLSHLVSETARALSGTKKQTAAKSMARTKAH